MRLCRSICAAIALLFALAPAVARVPGGGVQTPFTLPHVEAQIIIKLAAAIDPGVAATILSVFNGVVVDRIDSARLVLLSIDADADLAAAIGLAQSDPRFEFAEPNYIHATQARPNDLDFAQQWAKDNTGVNAPMGLGTPGADLNLVEAWDMQATAPGVVVAIIDDAVETTHVDLVGNVLSTGKCFASPNSQRPCGNGPDDPNPASSDDSHGTLVAGTAGARGNNALGIAGSAWQLALLPLKVDLSIFAIVRAVDEALAQNASVINMSFGGPGNSVALSEAVDRARDADVLIVAAAGNADASNDRASHYPSDYPQANVLSVAASNATDHIAAFSQWGSLNVDLAAPGQRTRTTAIGNNYAVVSGTSFAAPHVAGVAALVKAHTGATGFAPLVAHLLAGGVDGVTALGPVVPGQDKRSVPGRVATGRLDAARALDGPTGGIVLIDAMTIDDSLSGNNNGELDPGETAFIEITLRNRWLAEAGVSGILSTADSALLSINDSLPVAFGAIARDATASARFSVSLAAGADSFEALFLRLDLTASGTTPLPSRYFYLDVGTLSNGATATHSMNRWDWDEFHAWHIDVPAGSTQLTVSTAGTGDVDLLLRRSQPPSYLITLNAESRGVRGFYYVDRETQVSGEEGSGEFIRVANPQEGTYHVVVVNYGQTAANYELTASYVAAGVDVIAFSAPVHSVSEDGQSIDLEVSRSGGLQAASVDFQTRAGSAAAGDDYVATSGTLTWSVGESGVKMVRVALRDDDQTEASETFTVELSNTTGASLGRPAVATVNITDNETAPAPAPVDPPAPGEQTPISEQSSGGGGAAGLAMLLAGVCFAVQRRRIRRRLVDSK